jgi:DNA-binding Lrp family transcriptional regulator
MSMTLDTFDRALIRDLQGGFPVEHRPFAALARQYECCEQEVVTRVASLVERGLLSRFGPLYDVQEMGGAVCLAAMAVPPARFEEVTALVNAHAEVAHNYERAHPLNMWFVLSCEDKARIDVIARQIEQETGIAVQLMPKLHEFFIGFRVEV